MSHRSQKDEARAAAAIRLEREKTSEALSRILGIPYVPVSAPAAARRDARDALAILARSGLAQAARRSL